MNSTFSSKSDTMMRLKAHLKEIDPSFKLSDGDPPLRSELFNAEQMEQYGKVLASGHIVDDSVTAVDLLGRLSENEEVIKDVHHLILESLKANHQITPAGEWLLDNFYLIEDHIRLAKMHLPKRYSRELPRLSNGPSAGLPRVYDIAKEVISHGDGRIDSESLRRFIKAYQSVTTLTIGELWAIPIMLRFALIENLRRVSFIVALGRIDRNLADFWADQIIDILDKDPKSIILVTSDMARSNPPMTPAFVSGFARRLQGKNSALALPITWVEQRLSQENQTISQLIRIGSQQLAANQVSISNSIAGLRLLGAMNWKEFVEDISVIDSILRSDPAGVYHKMDFQSRDDYRHAIEKLSKKSTFSESEIAEEAIRLSLQAQKARNSADRKAHVGYYLVDKGKYLLEKKVQRHRPVLRLFHSQLIQHPGWIYFTSVIVFTICIALLLAPQVQKSLLPLWLDSIIYLLIALSASQLIVSLVNWVTTLVVPPKKLPRIDLSRGITSDNRTLVVVPCMLLTEEQIEKLAGHLEVRFLANRDPDLLFGLLTDFQDAGSENLPGDYPLVNAVRTKIEELNRKYESENHTCFYLFHRPRKYNRVENVWMGYERKRGKLADLNALIKRKANAFSDIIGNRDLLYTVKYVITLDVDTDLPRDSAHQMIGAMVHPLNRPVYEPKRAIIVDGYTILQPRVAVSLPGANKSLYARLFANEPGIDPYTKTTSDVYQDLFNEGSFIGKGIYDVDSFERILSNRLPENRVLSHDLLEGCYTRSGLLSDTLLFEEYPITYFTDVKRRHRWIRGDWQLLPWLRLRIHSFHGTNQWNPLSALSLWKISDNLRRSLIALASILLLIAGWTILSQPWLWTMAVVGFIIIPPLIVTLTDMLRKPEGVAMIPHLKGSRKLIVKHLTQSLFQIISLPFEAWYCADAILRTLWRMTISGKNLLEWNSEASSTRFSYTGLTGLFFSMWISPFLAFALIMILIFYYPASLLTASPILILWILAPLIIWWLDRPIAERRVRLTDEQVHFLRTMSRRIWAFFEKFVTAEENWLPPDNYQEHPNPVVAHRTSPTNMGLSLLANLTAYDFGYISAGELLNRTSGALDTMSRMEKYQGHFFNWYDTLSLKPMMPLYISSVDSGNLAGHLITLRSGLSDLAESPVISDKFIEGLKDTLSIVKETSGGKISDELLKFSEEVDNYPADFSLNINTAWEYTARLTEMADKLVNYFALKDDINLNEWIRLLIKQCHDVFDDLKFLMSPWLTDIRFSSFTFTGIPTLRELANLHNDPDSPAFRRITKISELLELLNHLTDMNYGFLYDRSRKLQSIGFNVEDRRLDAGYYDLLASEARLSTYVAIAQGQIPQESWFAMSRVLAGNDGEAVLLSWSGSMFEYLMPLIVMPVYENTLIHKACMNAIAKQIDYGSEHDIPWGVSESGYNMFDQNLNYQYKAFGIPGLGLKRGLSDDLVIAPYASVMAILLKPAEACKNMERLASDGFIGKYGFYEAIDYTPSRLPRGHSHVIIRSYMSHHQGMSFLALSGFLLNRPMQKRFEADSLLQASMLLLQERIPRYSAYHDFSDSDTIVRSSVGPQELPTRVYKTAYTPIPEVHFLSNGRYHVMLTNSGSGYSRWNDLAVSRWREDGTLDNTGTFCYIRDAESMYFWSPGYQPTQAKPDRYEVVFSEGRAEFKRRDKEIDTYMEVVVSPEDDIELRRVHLNNRTRNKRIIDIISYSELVLTHPASEATHPAFTNLFVQTEIVFQRQAILATRRPRSAEEKVNWMFHLVAVHGAQINNISYETDRLKFLGRGNTPERPYALTGLKRLGNSEGSVLDPIAAIQYQIILEPDETVVVDMVTGMTEAREVAMGLIEKYQDRQLANRVFELAWTHSQVMLQQINAVESDARLYGRLAGNIVFHNRSMRPESNVIMRNRRGQSALWGYSISGDLPIILIQIEDPDNISLLRQLIQAHSYWRLKGLTVDMVIWIEDFAGYRQILYDQIMAIIAGGIEAGIVGRSGGIFIRTGDQISVEDRILFQSAARVVISDRNGTLADQLNRHISIDPLIAPLKTSLAYIQDINSGADTEKQLEFFNGKGGFTPDGREYIIFTSEGNMTPLPWSNVLANSRFGTVLTENGQAYTWSENAHEYRLTPWHNDPVSDKGGEMIYLRDEESGHYWSPTPFIKIGSKIYKTRHGFGYSIFENSETGIETELCIYVSAEDPVKFSVLKITNNSGRRRKLSATGYVEWVLGELRSKTGMHVVTSIDIDTGAILAHNSYNYEFPERVSFFQASENLTCSFTCDRTEFLGRNGSMANPVALKRTKLSGRRGAAIDPCAAIQANFEIEEGQQKVIAFILGSGINHNEAINLSRKYLYMAAARAELEKVWSYWKDTLGCITAETPDRALNYLINGWLLYQTLTSRILARSGYYQSGGAYGFRDQLQDAMAVVHCSPHILFNQIILHAGRQFLEGDVQHWWHPPTGRGVRTRCSDDLLWLPLATCRYIITTGDLRILEESVHFLEGRPLNPEEESYYDLPVQSGEKGSVYEHCKRAIENSLKFGAHGLPLIGSHDWNDGMNKIGHKGKGESVWLGFFLYDVLMQFAHISEISGNPIYAEKCRIEAEKLQRNLETHAWDGKWYLRAFFDDGSPLGSHINPEGKIDSISQSWAVISDAGNATRTQMAMQSVNYNLVRRDIGIVQLLDPAFDKSELNPGYIKGYVPGVRENGGQYTHAAIWTIMAFAKLRDKKNAWEILSLINPINHSLTMKDSEKYKVEPYVVAADVYSLPPHTGRGGWTWYTGSAGWMYRMITESMLGLKREAEKLFINPLMPDEWKSFQIDYRYQQTTYKIHIIRKDENTQTGLFLDGNSVNETYIVLFNDEIEHHVSVII